jgi:hypothetical protein
MTDKTNQPDGVREAVERALFHADYNGPEWTYGPDWHRDMHPDDANDIRRRTAAVMVALSALKASVPGSLEGEKEGLSSARDHDPGTGGSCEGGLLPCPFCGSSDIDPEEWMSSTQNGDGTETIKSGPGCGECGATADSVERWNTRPLSSHDQQTAKGQVPALNKQEGDR